MEESIFTKIINGDIPCHKVYEDDLTLAFMDIHPVQLGHVLVVPKKEINHFYDLETTDYQAVWETVKKIAKAQKKTFNTQRVGVKIEGFDVPHAHVHLIPVNNIAELKGTANMSAEPNHAMLAHKANEIKENL